MILLKKTAHLAAYFHTKKILQQEIGFVPTMGALHEGHLSLLRQSLAENRITVCSIFVNPTQFNDPADYLKYPITIETDIEKISAIGTDILFMPTVEEIYPHGTTQLSHFDLGHLETVLEGKFRPGHFQGVCQVMSRLLTAVRPGNLYMGQKDYQQCLVISRLIQMMDEGVVLHTCPTLREPDGLAMSSRNVRLSREAREKASTIFQVLQEMKSKMNANNTDLQLLVQDATGRLEAAGFKVDYVAIANADTLEPIEAKTEHEAVLGLIAAFIDGVRLIDNMRISPVAA